jgi:hypothetical protein
MFFPILFDCVILSDVMFVTCVCMRAHLYVIIFPAIEMNEECAEEGEVFEYQEKEDQGLASQGKPSTCCISGSY